MSGGKFPGLDTRRGTLGCSGRSMFRTGHPRVISRRARGKEPILRTCRQRGRDRSPSYASVTNGRHHVDRNGKQDPAG